MLRFNRIRLTGFKSFVDPTDLHIEPGLTGVVGPNGCGKSNLVEALKWVMGETSAKQMRGSGMDDVIFSGTSDRPARNLAEVLLRLENPDRTAPAQFNDQEELEVVRRIERDRGSLYKVNGREVRARDVQLLFADSATGARSTALVSQGRVGAVIAARPTERRLLLEEAAGITGLHSRRHEAELRLRGAETNLERLDDVLGTLETQLAHLKKQARQATRYRNLSDHIRRAEATLFHLRWLAATEGLGVARKSHEEAEAQVKDLTVAAAGASTKQAEAAATLPELRRNEAEAAAKLQRLLLARDGLEAEEKRIEAATQDARTRLGQIDADSERERTLSADAAAAAKGLDDEKAAIVAEREGEASAKDEAEQAFAEASAKAAEQEARVNAMAERIAADEARRVSLERAANDLAERKTRLTERATQLDDQIEALERESDDGGALEEAERNVAMAFEAAEAARADLEAAERARARAHEETAAALAARHDAEAETAKLEAEEAALAGLLEGGEAETFPPLLDSVTVEHGLETALGVALGEDLNAPLDEPAPMHWRTLSPLDPPPPLPHGAEPLDRFVQAPPALARRLSQIGLADGEDAARGMLDALLPGQRLVTREGAYWRWDGYTVSAGAPTAAATRLAQRNRLVEVRERLEDARPKRDAAISAADQARAAEQAAAETDKAAREAVRAADAALTGAREVHARIKERLAAQTSRIAALKDSAQSVTADLEETDGRAGRAAADLAGLPDTAAQREDVQQLRMELAELRAVQVERKSALDAVVHAGEAREKRLGDIERDLSGWRERGAGAGRQLEQLAERKAALTEELERLAKRPAEIKAQRDSLAGSIETAETKRKAAADALAQADTAATEANRALKERESALAQAREAMVRAEGAVGQAKAAIESLTERVAERLECHPSETFALTGLEEGADPPELDAVEARLARLQRERETMGPVNLRAEQEAEEQSEQIETLNGERDDLVRAIDKLRQGIAEINREGRQRLLASFKLVDRHFQDLFVRLFGGGRAHLTLTESDDPLDAGLEIMASPPGKRLQALSLLSGGEQALTALALLFAVFMTNPAPICVLDEVDAPLDDANVDRFCTLLEDMAEAGRTRFLIITHHRMTMARMHRLFGVTMSERGVSQLVSVDLRRAEEIRDSA